MRHRERTVLGVVLAIVLATILAGSVAGCAGNPAPILVGNGAIAATDSIDVLSTTGAQLADAKIISPEANLGFQRQLLAIIEKMKPLPDLLRTIDRLQTAGDPTSSEADKAIAILTVIGQDISLVIAGMPMSDATASIIKFIRAAQQAVQTVLVEVAKIRGREQL